MRPSGLATRAGGLRHIGWNGAIVEQPVLQRRIIGQLNGRASLVECAGIGLQTDRIFRLSAWSNALYG
jgi:hypothetical protein